jgi:hypothetical protein
MEVSNGKDIIIGVYDTPTMGRKFPLFYLDLTTDDPRTFCEDFAGKVKWNLLDVVVTGLKGPHGLGSAAELVERFIKNV